MRPFCAGHPGAFKRDEIAAFRQSRYVIPGIGEFTAGGHNVVQPEVESLETTPRAFGTVLDKTGAEGVLTMRKKSTSTKVSAWVSAVLTMLLLAVAASWSAAATLAIGTDAAPDSAPPPAPKFVRPAKAMFVDDFADESLKGWTTDQASVWSVRNGTLRAELPDGKQLHSFLYAGDSSWVDYAVDFDVCGIRGVDKGCAVRVQPGRKGLGMDLRGPGYHDLKLYVNQFPVGSAAFANPNGTWYHVRIEIRGHDRCRVAIDGKVVLDQRLRPAAPARGGIALSAYTGGIGMCTVYYDNVAVSPLVGDGAPRP